MLATTFKVAVVAAACEQNLKMEILIYLILIARLLTRLSLSKARQSPDFALCV